MRQRLNLSKPECAGGPPGQAHCYCMHNPCCLCGKPLATRLRLPADDRASLLAMVDQAGRALQRIRLGQVPTQDEAELFLQLGRRLEVIVGNER